MALTSIALWFTSKECPLQLTSNTILINRAEVATSVYNLAIKFELKKSAKSRGKKIFEQLSRPRFFPGFEISLRFLRLNMAFMMCYG